MIKKSEYCTAIIENQFKKELVMNKEDEDFESCT